MIGDSDGYGYAAWHNAGATYRYYFATRQAPHTTASTSASTTGMLSDEEGDLDDQRIAPELQLLPAERTINKHANAPEFGGALLTGLRLTWIRCEAHRCSPRHARSVSTYSPRHRGSPGC